jgi:hypothetical protein
MVVVKVLPSAAFDSTSTLPTVYPDSSRASASVFGGRIVLPALSQPLRDGFHLVVDERSGPVLCHGLSTPACSRFSEIRIKRFLQLNSHFLAPPKKR